MDRLVLDTFVVDVERAELERKLVRRRQIREARAEKGRARGTRRWLAGRLLAYGLRVAPPEMAREWAQAALCDRRPSTA